MAAASALRCRIEPALERARSCEGVHHGSNRGCNLVTKQRGLLPEQLRLRGLLHPAALDQFPLRPAHGALRDSEVAGPPRRCSAGTSLGSVGLGDAPPTRRPAWPTGWPARTPARRGREPQGAALAEYMRRGAAHARYAPDVTRHFAAQQYGGIDVEDRLVEVTHPVFVLAGRHDRTCAVGALQDMAPRLPNAQLVVFGPPPT